MAESWPDVLKPHNIGWWLENSSRSGGIALNGMEQTVSSMAGRWRAEIHFTLRTKAQVLAYRGLMGALNGRAGEVDVPAFDGKRINWPIDQWGRTLHPGFTRRKQLEDTIYEDPAIPPESEIIAVAIGDADLGATQMIIRTTQGQPLERGQLFGIGARLYKVLTIVSTNGLNQTITFTPPLRSASDNNMAIHVTRAVCRMKLVDDGQVALLLEQARFADKALQFVEAY